MTSSAFELPANLVTETIQPDIAAYELDGPWELPMSLTIPVSEANDFSHLIPGFVESPRPESTAHLMGNAYRLGKVMLESGETQTVYATVKVPKIARTGLGRAINRLRKIKSDEAVIQVDAYQLPEQF